MDRHKLRLQNLRLLITEAGSISVLARKLDTSSANAYISQIINGAPTKTGKPRAVGDEFARKLEVACRKPVGWMDQDHSPEAQAALPYPEKVLQLAGDIADLPEEVRDGFLSLIHVYKGMTKLQQEPVRYKPVSGRGVIGFDFQLPPDAANPNPLVDRVVGYGEWPTQLGLDKCG